MTNNININGVTVEKAMVSLGGKKDIFDDLYSVRYNDTVILYIKNNGDNNYDTIELLNFPSIFHKCLYSISAEKVTKVVHSIIKGNFKKNR